MTRGRHCCDGSLVRGHAVPVIQLKIGRVPCGLVVAAQNFFQRTRLKPENKQRQVICKPG